MGTALVVISGVCWTIAYIELIRGGFRDKTCGMPLFALGLNFAWEVLYSIDGLFINRAFVLAQSVANVAWACCDVAILVSFFKFGRGLVPKGARSWFVPYTLLALATCAVAQLAFYLHFDNVVAASQYSAFAQNAVMSILFLNTLLNQDGAPGQSMLMAVCKCVGTVAPTILGGIVEGFNIYILLMGAICLVFDVTYIVCLGKLKQVEKVASH
jgi:hypothetical protein